jgi:hypothetical protein
LISQIKEINQFLKINENENENTISHLFYRTR